MVGAEAAGSNRDVAISNFGLGVADLVTVGAQVACATIEGAVGVFKLYRLFTSSKREIIPRIWWDLHGFTSGVCASHLGITLVPHYADYDCRSQ